MYWYTFEQDSAEHKNRRYLILYLGINFLFYLVTFCSQKVTKKLIVPIAIGIVIGNSSGPLLKATRLLVSSLRCFSSYCCTKS
jgi:hypothetical protein